jgi:hypothetical protein
MFTLPQGKRAHAPSLLYTFTLSYKKARQRGRRKPAYLTFPSAFCRRGLPYPSIVLKPCPKISLPLGEMERGMSSEGMSSDEHALTSGQPHHVSTYSLYLQQESGWKGLRKRIITS